MAIKGSEGISKETLKLQQEAAAQHRVKKDIAPQGETASSQDKIEIGTVAKDIRESLNVEAEDAAHRAKFERIKAAVQNGTYDSSISGEKLQAVIRNMSEEVGILQDIAEE